jgi:uncharacterized protein YjdB
VKANTYYVAPSGSNDSYPGTVSQPWATWQKACNTAGAGDTVYFREGAWYTTSTVYINPSIGLGHNGTYENPICFYNYPGESPILDCIQFPITSVSTSGFDIYNATYLKFKGLTIRNVRQTTVGQWISGLSYVSDGGTIYFENIISTGHGGTGIWISGYDTLYLMNCDSYNHCDNYPANGSFPGGRADGYNITSGGSASNTFKIAYIRGCRAWYCSDDGFDVSSTKQVEISNCWSWANGRLEGDATGIKVSYSHILIPDKRKIHNCITAYNVDQTNNYGGGIVEVNLTSAEYGPVYSYYNNSSYRDWMGYVSVLGAFDCNANETSVICRNNIVYDPTNTSGFQAAFKACNYNFPTYVKQDHNTWIQTGENYNTEPNDTFNVNQGDFVSLDTAQLRQPRKPDGSLPEITFMKLVASSDMLNAGIDVGLSYVGFAPDLGYCEHEIPVAGIVVYGEGGSMVIDSDNGTLQLIAIISPSDATNKNVTWTIQNVTGQATISSTGLVKAVSNGTVRARATANDGSGVYDQLDITISNQIFIPVNNITIVGAGGSTTINTANGTLQLYATMSPENAEIKTVTWSIINNGTDQAQISSTGMVTAVLNGRVTARAMANDGSGVYGQLSITISNQIVLVAGIVVSVNGGATSINSDNGTLQMNAAITPANATNQDMTWSIQNNTGQASINTSGLVNAIANGTVTAKATANDGSGVYGTLGISISNQVIPVTGIIITGAGETSTISENNGTLQLSASISPDNATNKTVTWTMQNESGQATISVSGLVTAITNGTVTARATAIDGSGVYGTLLITVTNQAILVNSIQVTSVGGAETITTPGGALQLTAEVLPANATNKTVQWSVQNISGQATVNSNGLVTAVADGTVTVIATATDESGISDFFQVSISNQVYIPVSEVVVTSENDLTSIMEPQGTLQLYAEILPTNATNQSFFWELNNLSGDATISADGLITAHSNGLVYVKALSQENPEIFDYLILSISGQSVLIEDWSIEDFSISINNRVITINTNDILDLNGTLRVLDLTGRKIVIQDLSGEIEIRIPETGPDLYFLQFIFNDNQVLNWKLFLP